MTGTPTRTLNGMTGKNVIPLPADGQWTWDDLQAIPDQAHHHYQLIEGQILMSPSPNLRHQMCVGRLFVILYNAAPTGFDVVPAPFDFVPEPGTALQPDLLVIRRGTTEDNRTVAPPVLAVEVLSPSSRTTDEVTKRALYERFGVAHYWIVDPAAPAVRALRRDASGHYGDALEIAGSAKFAVDEPFAVRFSPEQLVAD
jgi:Uma2 family endonuclease